jgi:hypothetical protein
MRREQAWQFVQSKLKTQNLLKHTLAVEAVMRHVARELGQDEEVWGLAGLLHDIDYDYTKDDPNSHGLVSAGWLAKEGIRSDIVEAVKAHADRKVPQTPMEKAISCADPVTGFLVACALIHPQKKLSPIDVQFAKNRMKEKRFAAGASREKMESCTQLGLSLDRFLEISLMAMKQIALQLGL